MEIKRRITAHRGLTEFGEKENTINAFEAAIKYNIEAVELDVHKTKDNILVVHHDFEISNLLIKNTNYEDLLKIKPDLPTLENVINLAKNKLFLDIEIKDHGYEEEVVTLVKKYLNYDEYFIRSFLDNVLITVKKIDNKIKTGLLLGVNKCNVFKRLSELFPSRRILKTKCDFVSPHYRLLILGYIKRMHIIHKPVITWTLNNIVLMKKLWHKKIDGIITDLPVEAMKQLGL